MALWVQLQGMEMTPLTCSCCPRTSSFMPGSAKLTILLRSQQVGSCSIGGCLLGSVLMLGSVRKLKCMACTCLHGRNRS